MFLVDGMELTTQQKSRLRKAYRDAFEAESYGKAMVALYERFTELYGMTVDEIWAFLADEREKRDMQSVVAAAVAKKASEGGVKAAPTIKIIRYEPPEGVRTQQSDDTSARKPVEIKRTCEVCGNRVGASGSRGVAKHKRKNGNWCSGTQGLNEKSRRTKKLCEVCGKKHGVRRADGRLVWHIGLDGKDCRGSGRASWEGRRGKHMKLAPPRAVGGGLPGLGRRG